MGVLEAEADMGPQGLETGQGTREHLASFSFSLTPTHTHSCTSIDSRAWVNPRGTQGP